MTQQKKLIIFTHGGGRFANQLILYAQLIAFLIDSNYKYDLINLSFSLYSNLISTTSQENFCIFPTKHNQYKLLILFYRQLGNLSEKYIHKINKIFLIYLYFYGLFMPKIQTIIVGKATGTNLFGKRLDELPLKPKIKQLDLENFQDISIFEQTDITFLCGWQIRCWNLVKKYQEQIRVSLSLEQKYMNIAVQFIHNLRKKYDFLIGVLIRHNDYKQWLDGKYYFETEQYIDWMIQATQEFSDCGKVGFVIAADYPKDMRQFKSLNAYFSTGIAGGEGHYLESMAELSLCDIIMTPPSTFSIWSGFLGNTPILPLYKPDQMISHSDLLKNHLFDALDHPDMSLPLK